MGAFYLIAPLVGVSFGIVLAALVVLQRRRSPLHRVFLVFLVSMTSWALTVFGMRNSPLEQALPWEMAIFAVLPIVSVSSYHLVLLLTHANRAKGWLLVAYGLALVFIALTPAKLVASEMRSMWYGSGFVAGPLFIPYIILFYGFVVLGIYELVRAYRSSASPVEKNRYIYVAIGACFCLVGLLIDVLAARGLHIYPLGIISNVVFLLLCSYAILKYQLFDVQLVLRTGVVYAVVYTMVAGLIVTLIYLYYLLGFTSHNLLNWKTIAFSIGTIILLLYVIRRLENWLDRLFHRSKYDYLRAMEALSDNTRTITDLNFITRALITTVVDALKADKVLLLLPDLEEKHFVPVSSMEQGRYSSISLPYDGILAWWLKNNAHVITRREIEVMPQFQALTIHERELLTELGVEVIVPLHIGQNLTGILTLGHKLSDQDYSLEEITILRVVANQMATTLDNARLYKLQTERYLEQSLLTNLGMIVSAELDLDKVYSSLIKELSKSVDIDYFCIHLIGDGTESTPPNFVWTRVALDQASEEGIRAIDCSGQLSDEFKYEANLDSSGPNYRGELYRIGIHSVVHMSLQAKGVILGNFAVGSAKPEAYGEDKLRLLRQVALQLTIAVDNSRLYRLEKKAMSDLQREFKERTRFVDGLIHEVKTPLTAMLASSELLKEELAPNASVLSELASNMDDAVRNLNRRISELVQFSKLQRTAMTLNLEDVDINKVIHEVVSQTAGLLLNKKQTIRVEIQPSIGPIRCDSDRLMQILLNLLTNAAKYGPIGDSLVLKVHQLDNSAIIEMCDGGQPLTPQELELVFTPYQQGRRKEGGGLGLGLYICKKLVELHGGRIWLETKATGNQFKFSLPLANQEAKDESSAN